MGRASRVEYLEQHIASKQEIHLVFKKDWVIEIHKNDGKVKTYTPTKTGVISHSDNSDIMYLQGPFGSGKSVICVNDILHCARYIPKWKGTMRASKWGVIRNTSGELKTTTLDTWLEWYGDVGEINKNEKPVLNYRHQLNYRDERDGDEGIIYLEMIFLPLDGEDVLRKIDSLNLTGAYINEMRHLPKELLNRIVGRCNRYPSKDEVYAIGEDYEGKVLADSNPPKVGHWIQSSFELERPPGWKMIRQPTGLLVDDKKKPIVNEHGLFMDNPEHDTYKYMDKKYYQRLATGANEEFVKVYCLGEYGLAQDGKPVYAEYNDDIHSMSGLVINKALPIYIGWDYGLTPSAIIIQRSPRGAILVVKEFISDNMGITSFVTNLVIPWLQEHYPEYLNRIALSVGDPAGNIRVQTDERTCMEILGSFGFRTIAAPTNSIIRRVEAVKHPLNRMIDGKAALIVSREGAPMLREGFMSGYHYRRMRTGGGLEYKYTEEPEKNEYSHPHDAFQYPCLHFYAESKVSKPSSYEGFSHIVGGL